MSQICPYCGQGFKRLASHQYRCKQKPPVASGASPVSKPNNAAGLHVTHDRSFAFGEAGQAYTPQSQPMQKCRDCGGTYKNLANHKVCHGRANTQTIAVEVPMQKCPACGGTYKNLANHKVCHRRANAQSIAVEVPMQKCPACGGTYKNLANHKVCHGRVGRTPQNSDVPVQNSNPSQHRVAKREQGRKQPLTNDSRPTRYVKMQRCLDCGKYFKNISNHRKCHGGRSDYTGPQFEMFEQCPDCEMCFKSLQRHKVCHGKARTQVQKKESLKVNPRHSVPDTPPASPRSNYDDTSPQYYDYEPAHDYPATPELTPPREHQYDISDNELENKSLYEEYNGLAGAACEDEEDEDEEEEEGIFIEDEYLPETYQEKGKVYYDKKGNGGSNDEEEDDSNEEEEEEDENHDKKNDDDGDGDDDDEHDENQSNEDKDEDERGKQIEEENYVDEDESYDDTYSKNKLSRHTNRYNGDLNDEDALALALAESLEDERSNGSDLEGACGGSEGEDDEHVERGRGLPVADNIPIHTPKPQPNPVEVSGLPKVIFDLETTGFGTHAHILQIAAACDDSRFNTYVFPGQPITSGAEGVTGIHVRGHRMYKHDQVVRSYPVRTAIKQFIHYLLSFGKPVLLVAHNCKTFDSRILLTTIHNCHLVDHILQCVAGFSDTLPLFREIYPDRKSHSLFDLFVDVMGNVYEAHDAVTDVDALRDLLSASPITSDLWRRHSFSLDYVLDILAFLRRKKHLLRSLSPLTRRVSTGMQEKIAESGLGLAHLHLGFLTGGRDALAAMLSEDIEGKPRVTNSRRLIDEIYNFFVNNSIAFDEEK